MRTVVLYAALLGVAMVGSYLSWTAKDTGAVVAEEVPVYRASAGDVKALAFHSEDVDVRVERREDDRGAYAWIEVEERKDPTKPAKVDDEAPPEEDEEAPEEAPAAPEAPPAEPVVTKSAFTGGEKALGLFETYEPLMARREIDSSLANTPSFGFDTPEGTVTVTRKSGGEETLVIGASTYGTRDRYAKVGDKLFLLADTKVRPLQFAATRLRERRLHPWLEADVDGVDVTRDGQLLAIEQRNKDDRAKAFWARSGEENEDATAATWVEKVLRLKASAKDETPAGDLTPLAEIRLRSDGQTWALTLASDGTEDGRFVTSGFLRSTVGVSKALADEIVADLDELVAN
ncbi:MAG: DUF4340 domain-containing protein [Myxococcales bacterium]|nr:DUF4340 domain-containing protein [Myxococcales bacterium]